MTKSAGADALISIAGGTFPLPGAKIEDAVTEGAWKIVTLTSSSAVPDDCSHVEGEQEVRQSIDCAPEIKGMRKKLRLKTAVQV